MFRRTNANSRMDELTPEIALRRLLVTLPAHRYRIEHEKAVQDGVAAVLYEHGIPFKREHVAGADRFDFLCCGSIVIEVKIAGSLPEALRQADRYCAHEFVSAVVIANTRFGFRKGAASQIETLRGKPVHTIHLPGRWF